MTSRTAPDARTLEGGSFKLSEVSDDAFLGGALRLYQPKSGFRAGIDAVLLAATVASNDKNGKGSRAALGSKDSSFKQRVLDVGAGVGTVGMCVTRRIEDVHVTLVEKNSVLVGMAFENRQRNGFEDRVDIVAADICAPAVHIDETGLKQEDFDIVLANPPFHILGSGTPSNCDIKKHANAMAEADLENWLRFISRMCAPHGTATVIHKASELDRLLGVMGGRFGALRVLPIHPRQGLPANRVLVTGVKNSKAELMICPGLILHDEGHRFSETVDAILRKGATLEFPG